METRQIKSSLKHVAWYVCLFAKVPKGFPFTFSIQIFTFPYSFSMTVLVDSPSAKHTHN